MAEAKKLYKIQIENMMKIHKVANRFEDER
jgi:hypothetical protein